MNPLSPQAVPMSEGNLWVSTSVAESSSNTIGMESGKWYFEVLPDSSSFTLGIVNNPNIRLDTTSSHVVCAFNDGGTVSTPNSTEGSDTFSSGGSGDIYGFAIDADAKTLDVYQNNTKVIEVNTFTIDAPYFFSVDRNSGVTVNEKMNFGADSSFAGTVTAQGNQDSNEVGDFYYTPPSLFLALCTSNLPDPEIALPTDYFNTVLYTGTGSIQTISGVGFQSDFTWIKSRSAADQHNAFDAVRTNGLLVPNTNAVQGDTGGGWLRSWDSDGFSVDVNGPVNTSADTYVAWNWKASGAPTADNSAGVGATPTAGSVKIDGSNLGSALAGSIAATRISANTTSGFSIVKFTNNNIAGATIAHGLSQAPEMLFTKITTSAYSWYMYHVRMDATAPEDYVMYLDNDSARSDDAGPWNDAKPSASVFTLGAEGTNSVGGVDVVSYCFHSVEGYSKMGGYIGNGNADGPFIYTGFRPAYIMIKVAPSWSGGHWHLFDTKRYTYNETTNTTTTGLTADNATNDGGGGGEGAGPIDILSNGFKIRNNNGNDNANGDNILYMAFAESPFKTANAR